MDFFFFKEPHWKDLVDGYRLLSQNELDKLPKPAKLVWLILANLKSVIKLLLYYWSFITGSATN